MVAATLGTPLAPIPCTLQWGCLRSPPVLALPVSSSSGPSRHLGCTEICPKKREDLRCPESAKWFALELHGISTWDSACSHLTCSTSCSAVHRIASHRSLCWMGPLALLQLWCRHRCNHPNTPFTMSNQSGQVGGRSSGLCPSSTRRDAYRSPWIFVSSSSSGMNVAVSLSPPKDTPYPPTLPNTGCGFDDTREGGRGGYTDLLFILQFPRTRACSISKCTTQHSSK